MHDVLEQQAADLARLAARMRTSRDDDDPVDLASRFVPYEKCPLLVRAFPVHRADRMLDGFMRIMQLLGF